MVLEQLDDDLDVGVVVFDGDDSHDVGGVLGVRVLAVLVGENQARVALLNLSGSGNGLLLKSELFLIAVKGDMDKRSV